MASILEKLKSKPLAKKQENVVIQFVKELGIGEKPERQPEERISLNVAIQDKTKANPDFNRGFVLQKLKQLKRVQKKERLVISQSEQRVEEVPIVGKEGEGEGEGEAVKQPKKVRIRIKGKVKKVEGTGETGETGERVKVEDLGKKVGKIRIRPQKERLEDKVIPLEKPVSSYVIKNLSINERMKKKPEDGMLLRASPYYLNNREIFINFINNKFLKYRDEVVAQENEEVSCQDKASGEFALLTHQKIIKEYINVYSPYRGLLIYHGLGSGKTCSSIAIAEGIKNDKKVIVMTPASLRQNYIEELKKCGDILYKKNQYWEFVNIDKKDDTTLEVMSKFLSLPRTFIKKNNGAWFVDTNKESNYEGLSTQDKISLENQLNAMIMSKYDFINYNGLRESHLNVMTKNGNVNPFENKVVIIDEAHNFVSRVVNKLKKKKSLSYQLYQYLMDAENCRVIFLTGTPIINYPNEIGVLFNMLRGFIKTYTIPLTIQTSKKITLTQIKTILRSVAGLDYMEYKPSSKKLIITRNPFGFVSIYDKASYKGVQRNDEEGVGIVSEKEFLDRVQSTLAEHQIVMNRKTISKEKFTCLPENLDEFNDMFINVADGSIKNNTLFKRRIIGLTSYFRSAREELMPRFNKETDLHVFKIPMSNYQLGEYEDARIVERDLEKQQAKKSKKKENEGVFEDKSSLYRIYSRSFCNFVFPKTIARPYPNENSSMSTNVNEDIIDNASVDEQLENPDGIYNEEDREQLEKEKKEAVDSTYETRIQEALQRLKDNEEEFLSPKGLETYSPKYLEMLKTINTESHKGLHLVYSQLRTLEGIGIFKLVLEANGYAEFRVKKQEDGTWKIMMKAEDRGKPTFALYTGTETAEEKEIIRNIFNSNWKFVPNEILEQIRPISSNNHYGEIIKIFMITSSGAEGISLKGVRYVHIMEPYWHPVRIEQVIGRARRICSHDALKEEERTVDVFIYLMEFSESQKDPKSDVTLSKELRLQDRGKVSDVPLTSDEYLYEISNIKEEINKQILKAIKESSIDCAVYEKNNRKEGLQCFSFSSKTATPYSYVPNIRGEEKDKMSKMNRKVVSWNARLATIDGKKYAFKSDTKELYDYDSYLAAKNDPSINPIFVGTLREREGKMVIDLI